MSDLEEEEYIDSSPIPISIANTEKILEQMKKCVCKIKKDNLKGTGFFAKIPYKSTIKNVLITNKHILNEHDIKEGKILKVSINNEKEYKDIEINNKKLILISEERDLTIIELKEKDNINNYLEIDERYNLDNLEERYKNESLYVLNYPKGQDIVVSYGLLNKMENEDLYHFCSTERGSSGSPILSLTKFKLIGIHGGYSKSDKCNLGIFIKYAIDEFNKLENNTLKKEENLVNNNTIKEIKTKSSFNSNTHNIPDIMNYNSDIKELHQMVANFYRSFPKINFLQYYNRIKELIVKNKVLISKKDSIFKLISLFDLKKT
jgi:V8-like Glu-specific endopeptidase